MRHYLSFGGGVNSVALHLLMLKEGYEFESVYVNHGTDWPETYHYVAGFQWWLVKNGYKPVKILFPNVQGYSRLIDYYENKSKVPSIMRRDCTHKFKIRTIEKYYQTPCFVHIGIDAGEAKRAKIATRKGVEHRYLLIEYDIDRDGCKDIIRSEGLPVPMKSGCWTCPFQRAAQWRSLRRLHPCLFKRAANLEKANIDERLSRGLSSFTISNSKKTLPEIVSENQIPLFEEDEYPPCQCGL